MKQMRTPLTPTRLARCKVIIEGFGESRADRALRDLFLERQFAFLDMLTDEAIELLAFRLIGDRADGNRRAALNRAIWAERTQQAPGGTAATRMIGRTTQSNSRKERSDEAYAHAIDADPPLAAFERDPTGGSA